MGIYASSVVTIFSKTANVNHNILCTTEHDSPKISSHHLRSASSRKPSRIQARIGIRESSARHHDPPYIYRDRDASIRRQKRILHFFLVVMKPALRTYPDTTRGSVLFDCWMLSCKCLQKRRYSHCAIARSWISLCS